MTECRVSDDIFCLEYLYYAVGGGFSELVRGGYGCLLCWFVSIRPLERFSGACWRDVFIAVMWSRLE